MKRVEIGKLEDFREGAIHGIDIDERKLIVVNLDGELHALDGICTHEYAELRRGFLTGDTVRCPLHFSQFDVETGEAITTPAEEPLEKFRVEVEGESVYLLLE
ncbi:MAG: non-heme iron oxygenase ferredoxin subunit [Thermoplasmata archaeon]